MRTSFKRVFCILLALCILAVAVAGLAACNGHVTTDESELPVGARPDLADRIEQSDLDVINGALAENSDAQAKKKAVLKLYDIANSSRIESGESLVLQNTQMGIKTNATADMSFDDNFILAIVSMHGYTLSSGDSWYNQFVASVVDNSGASSLMALFTSMVKISYNLKSDPDAYWFNIIKDSSAAPDCTVERFPYASFNLIQQPTKYDLDGYMAKANILTAPNEICNMDFSVGESIIADDVSITHEGGIYKVKFSVDPGADSSLLEQWYRMPKKDMAEGGQTLNAFLKYDCEFEVWDNGYAKSYYAEYVRDAGMGSGITSDRFSYIWNKDEIFDIISGDVRLDDLDIADKLKLQTIDDYINYYISADIVMGKLSPLYIALIVIGCVAFAVIVAVIVVEVLLRKGKLPKLAAKREAKKQKRLAKKAAKNGAAPKTDGDETQTDSENADGAHLDETSSETHQDEQ